MLDFVQQGPVADFQQPGRRLAVPAGLLERSGDGVAFGFSLYALDQRFESGNCGLRFGGIKSESRLFVLRQIGVPERHVAIPVGRAQVGRPVAHHQVAFDKFLQFPEIPRPRMLLAGFKRRR